MARALWCRSARRRPTTLPRSCRRWVSIRSVAPVRSGPFYRSARGGRFRPRAACDGRCAPLAGDRRRGGRPAARRTGATRAMGHRRRAYPGYAAFPSDDDDFDLAPPGSIMGARMPPPRAAPRAAAVTPSPQPPQAAAPPKPATKSADARPPVPRKRPGRRAAGSRRIGRAASRAQGAPRLRRRAREHRRPTPPGHAARIVVAKKKSAPGIGALPFRSRSTAALGRLGLEDLRLPSPCRCRSESGAAFSPRESRARGRRAGGRSRASRR